MRHLQIEPTYDDVVRKTRMLNRTSVRRTVPPKFVVEVEDGYPWRTRRCRRYDASVCRWRFLGFFVTVVVLFCAVLLLFLFYTRCGRNRQYPSPSRHRLFIRRRPGQPECGCSMRRPNVGSEIPRIGFSGRRPATRFSLPSRLPFSLLAPTHAMNTRKSLVGWLSTHRKRCWIYVFNGIDVHYRISGAGCSQGSSTR